MQCIESPFDEIWLIESQCQVNQFAFTYDSDFGEGDIVEGVADGDELLARVAVVLGSERLDFVRFLPELLLKVKAKLKNEEKAHCTTLRVWCHRKVYLEYLHSSIFQTNHHS